MKRDKNKPCKNWCPLHKSANSGTVLYWLKLKQRPIQITKINFFLITYNKNHFLLVKLHENNNEQMERGTNVLYRSYIFNGIFTGINLSYF